VTTSPVNFSSNPSEGLYCQVPIRGICRHPDYKLLDRIHDSWHE
jgi:hypothetical protein